MNADANTAHRTSSIVCTCGIEFRLIDWSIIENATAIRVRALGPLIKELHVTKKTARFSPKRSENDDDDDDDDNAFVNSAKMDGRESALHKRTGWRLHFTNFSHRREVGQPRSLIFPPFSLASRHSCSPSYFFLWLTKESRVCTAGSRNFLGLQELCSQLWVLCERVFLVYRRELVLAFARQYEADEGLWRLFRDADISNWKL